MQFPIGAIIVSAFAIIWVAAGTRKLPRPWLLVSVISTVVISAALILVSSRITPVHPVRFNPAAYNWSVVFEAFFIFLAIVILRRAGRKDVLLPVISFIVGLHFCGMVWALGSTMYYWVSGAMCAVAAATIAFVPPNLRDPVVGLGSAVILWCAAIWSLF